jgi:hypothetical protein
MPHVRSININSNRRIHINIHNIALFALWTFGFLITVSSKIKITICLFIPHPFLFPFCPSCSISFSSILSPFHLHSVFVRLPFSPSLSFPYILHLLSSPSVQYLFSLSSFLHLNFAIIFLSFAVSLHRYSGISSVIHLSYSLLYLDSLILFLFSCLSVSLSLSLSSTFIHLPFALKLSTSSLAYPFLW